MDIAGMGTHILECVRVRELLDSHAEKFIAQIYTDREAAFCRDRTHSTEYYAAIWAAKEAVFRSLGLKWKKGIDWRDVEIVCESSLEPRVELTGPTKERMLMRGVVAIPIAFSHSRLYATATAIAIRG
jgi:holo-[acyl-carrier protein] synthase